MFPWTYVTNHAIVLILVARHPMITAHELALELGISERAIHRIVADLYRGGYIAKEKDGRRVRYKVNDPGRLRHRNQKEKAVAEFFNMFAEGRKMGKKEQSKS